jgi:hypothetical protein
MKNKISVLIIMLLMSVGITAANNELMVCDHNGDGERNLADVTLFNQVKGSMDLNGDGVSDLSDVTLYAQNYDNDLFCQEHFSTNQEEEQEFVEPKRTPSSKFGSGDAKKLIKAELEVFKKNYYTKDEVDTRISSMASLLVNGFESQKDIIDCGASKIAFKIFGKSLTVGGCSYHEASYGSFFVNK